MMKRNPLKRREPLTDTMLLVTITIGIFFAMYFTAMAIWGAVIDIQQALQTRRRLEQAGLLYDGPGELILENSLESEQILALSHHLLEV